MRGSLTASDLNSGSVKKYLLILFLPSFRTVRHESKVTVKENQRLQWKTPIIQALIYPLCSNWNLDYFRKDEPYMRDVERYSKLPEKVFRNKTKKNWSAASQRMPIMYRTHLLHTSRQSRIRLRTIFPCGKLLLSFPQGTIVERLAKSVAN